MTLELAKELNDAGYPFKKWQVDEGMDRIDWEDAEMEVSAAPSLEELIEACGKAFHCLEKWNTKWTAGGCKYPNETETLLIDGSTPTEAVANLWLALQKVAKK